MNVRHLHMAYHHNKGKLAAYSRCDLAQAWVAHFNEEETKNKISVRMLKYTRTEVSTFK